jgi:hypothetical protein
MRNNIGPSVLPCMTDMLNVLVEEYVPLISTLSLRSNFETSHVLCPWFHIFQFFSKMLYEQTSKAFFKSRNSPIPYFLSFSAEKEYIWLMRWVRLCSVDLPFWNPYWWEYKRLFSSMWLVSWMDINDLVYKCKYKMDQKYLTLQPACQSILPAPLHLMMIAGALPCPHRSSLGKTICVLPRWWVQEIKCVYLASLTHGLFIT